MVVMVVRMIFLDTGDCDRVICISAPENLLQRLSFRHHREHFDMAEEFKPTKFEQELMDTPLTARDRRDELIGNVQAGLIAFFNKRAGGEENWHTRAQDGTSLAKLNGIFSLDEINAFIVAEIADMDVTDLIGENYEIEF